MLCACVSAWALSLALSLARSLALGAHVLASTRIIKRAMLQGARGNDCEVWIPPEIPDTDDDLVGERGEVTTKVYLDLRILKDYNKEVLEDGAVRGRIVIGLYGDEAPKTVAHFLQFFPKVPGEAPGYATGSFFRHEPGKWLEGGKISGLFPTQLAGSESYEWNGAIYPLRAPLEANSPPLRAPLEANSLRHDRKWLLSHKKFNAGPEFDILLSPASELDSSNTVFGEVLAGQDLLLEMAQLPFVTGRSLDPTGSVASNVWSAQNQYFRGLAKSLGDTRVQKTFPGKLLRRVEITKAGVVVGAEDEEDADDSVATPESGLKSNLQRQLFALKRKKQLQQKENEEARRLLEE
jgi:cyclophilin family peptidyl-prolyl cis-trans isomerase